MPAERLQFRFEPDVPLEEAEMSLHLALFAVEGLFGQARVRLDSAYELVREANAVLIDSATEVGATIARVFTGLLVREFGEDAFKVDRVAPPVSAQAA